MKNATGLTDRELKLVNGGNTKLGVRLAEPEVSTKKKPMLVPNVIDLDD